MVRERWPEFRERVESLGSLPKFVVREVDEYLRCGRGANFDSCMADAGMERRRNCEMFRKFDLQINMNDKAKSRRTTMRRHVHTITAIGLLGTVSFGFVPVGCGSRLGPVRASQNGGIDHANFPDITVEHAKDCVAEYGP